MKRTSTGLGVVIWLGQPFALAIVGNKSGLVPPTVITGTPP